MIEWLTLLALVVFIAWALSYYTVSAYAIIFNLIATIIAAYYIKGGLAKKSGMFEYYLVAMATVAVILIFYEPLRILFDLFWLLQINIFTASLIHIILLAYFYKAAKRSIEEELEKHKQAKTKQNT
ncbi:TPA: hypothetical protein HA270_06400 [Candidatus Woesearchaeota archaeon]|nr:hypothetical protein [Candidatus Woesearchaeota archaeon]